MTFLLTLLACMGGESTPLMAAPATTTVASKAGTIRVDVMDVGQGDSILIRSPSKTILIDASEKSADVVDKLHSAGVTALDLVIATHPHADHIGGMDDVVQNFPIKMYTDNGLPHTTQTYQRLMADITAKNVPYRAAIAGTVYNLDLGAKLEVLFPTGSPLSGTRSDLNANSVVTRLSYGSDCFLFVGDSEEPTEQALVSHGITPCGVLKVAHHGSEYSSTQAFIDAVHPSIALISVGTGNTYGHPGPETMQRLTASGAKIYRTDLQGNITALSTGHGVSITTGTALGDSGLGGSATATTVAPAPAPAPTPAPAPAAAACPFQGLSTSDVFHEADCGQLQRSDPSKRVCYATREAALAAGKRPAGCCDP